MLISRRTTIALLASAACTWPSSPPPVVDQLVGLTPKSVGAWFQQAMERQVALQDLLDAIQLAGVRRCADIGDFHHLLLAGPIERLGPTNDLVLWALVHFAEWLEYAVCPAKHNALTLPKGDWRMVMARASATTAPDPHPVIYASELITTAARLNLGQRNEVLRSAHRLLKRPDPRPDLTAAARKLAVTFTNSALERDLPKEVAQAVLESPADALLPALSKLRPTSRSLWQGLWWAAAAQHHGTGGILNPTHCVTLTAASKRLATSGSKGNRDLAWLLAFTTALRLNLHGPTARFDDTPHGSSSQEQWLAQARAPGPDMHDLKLCEAVAHCNDPVVFGLLAESQHLQPRPKWPELEAARKG